MLFIGFLMLIEYRLQKNFIAPFFVLLSSFFMSAFIIVLNVDNWSVNINDSFVIYIFTAMLSFGLGCKLVERFYANHNYDLNRYNELEETEQKLQAVFENYPVNVMLFFSLACTLLYVYFMITLYGGSADNVVSLLSNIYRADKDMPSATTRVMHQMLKIIIAMAQINLFAIFASKYVCKQMKVNKGLFIPLLCFLVCTTLSTDRNIFLRFVLYAFCLWILFYTSISNSEDKSIDLINWVIFKRAFVCIIIVAILFFGLGKVKNYQSDISKALSIYGGSGLYNFNLYLEKFDGNKMKYGEETFSVFLDTISRVLFIKNERWVNQNKEFIIYTSKNGYVYMSNVYSAFRPYIEDFGFFGVLLYPFILGMFYERLFIQTRKSKYGLSWVLYSLLLYPLVFITVAEQFFKRFHMGMVYEIGWVLLLYFLLFTKNSLFSKKFVIR